MTIVLPLLQGLFLALGLGALAFALVSLMDGIRFHLRMRERLGPESEPDGTVAVLVPVRGVDPTLEATLKALDAQTHPRYRLLFIVDGGDPVVRFLEGRRWNRPVQIVQAAPRPRCSGKIAALLSGLDALDEGDEVVAFADSDIVPDDEWLARLVTPLSEPGVAATTGYRWYFPGDGGFGAALQSAWNAAAGNVLFHPRWVYLWGGAMALRRTTLKEIDVRAKWERALSDDMVLTQALKDADRRIVFVPRATVATYSDASVSEALAWTHRQACLALLYAPAMRRLTLPYGLHVGSLGLGLIALGLVVLGPVFLAAAALLLSPVYLGLLKNAVRRDAFRRAMPAFQDDFSKGRLRFYLGVLVLPFVMLWNVRRARRMDRFAWRGKVYRFASPTDVSVEEED